MASSKFVAVDAILFVAGIAAGVWDQSHAQLQPLSPCAEAQAAWFVLPALPSCDDPMMALMLVQDDQRASQNREDQDRATQQDDPRRPRSRQRDQQAQEGVEHADMLSNAFQRVAEMISPSVVSVTSTRRVEVQQINPFGGSPFEDFPFEDFFGGENPFEQFRQRMPAPEQEGEGQGNQPRPPQYRLQQGVGSGFIVSRDGYILTNAHVVAGADTVEVRLSDDRTYTADVVGADPQTDVAVIRVNADDLQPAELGRSSDLQVGQWVLAVGSPFGLSTTITQGIVSATGRSELGIAEYEDLIQTDAAINPGNSGGPLVNLRGEVVGMNTAIATRTGGYMGIGFAIPIDMARTVMDSLIEHGKVVRGYIGVTIQNLTPGLARSFGYDGTDGVVVTQVLPDTPASRAGLEQGDIILEVADQPVEDVQDLRFRVASIAPGTKISLRVFRDGRERTVDATIEELPSQEVVSQLTDEDTPDLGMSVRTLTPDVARQMGVDEAVQGVVVSSLVPDGLAARAGIRPGDVIVAVGDEAVRTIEDFKQAIDDVDLEQGVRLTVRRGPNQQFVFIEETNSEPRP